MSTDLSDLLNESLIVRNDGDDNFVGTFQNQRWIIEPGQSAVIRREAACLWFGDPRQMDRVVNGREFNNRRDEVERIDLRYGICGFASDPGTGKPMPTRETDWPKITVKNQQGEEIRMIVHDPQGDSVVIVNQTVEENKILHEQMERMRQQLAAMEERMAQTPMREEGATEVPEDTPAASRRGRAS